MKRWLRLLLIAAALVGLTLASLYEYATHVGRGWLFGEAFFDGRPTSYWSSQIDRWVARYNSPKEAGRELSMARLTRFPPTIWERLQNALQPDRQPPNVLIAMSDAEPVLRELDAEARFHAFTKRARRNSGILAERAKPAAP